MKRLIAVMVLAALAFTARSETMVDRLLSTYDQVETVSCEVRRNIDGPAGRIRMLSRVYYQKPDRIHVDNVSPMKRRYVADGERMFYYVEGDPMGYSKPIAELDEDWLISLRKVPGSPMDILLTIQGAEESVLEPTPAGAVRKGYQTDKAFAVLTMDDFGRLSAVDLYRSPEMKYKTASYSYDNYKQYGDDLWFPLLHKAEVYVDGDAKMETTRITGIEVNKDIPDRLFVAEPFFKGVEFVDSFKKIYGE